MADPFSTIRESQSQVQYEYGKARRTKMKNYVQSNKNLYLYS